MEAFIDAANAERDALPSAPADTYKKTSNNICYIPLFTLDSLEGDLASSDPRAPIQTPFKLKKNTLQLKYYHIG